MGKGTPAYPVIVLAAVICGFCDDLAGQPIAEEQPAVATQAASAQRHYADGPLKPAEFTAAQPASLPSSKSGVRLLAATFTELHFTADYGYRIVRARYHLRDFKVRVFATFVPEKSWNAAREDLRLLAHEQGHFDLTECFARRAQQRIDKLIKQGRIRGAGPNEEKAREAAMKLIQKELALVVEEWNAEQKRYDDETAHGTDPTEQAKWRKQMDDELQGAADEKASRSNPAALHFPTSDFRL